MSKNNEVNKLMNRFKQEDPNLKTGTERTDQPTPCLPTFLTVAPLLLLPLACPNPLPLDSYSSSPCQPALLMSHPPLPLTVHPAPVCPHQVSMAHSMVEHHRQVQNQTGPSNPQDLFLPHLQLTWPREDHGLTVRLVQSPAVRMRRRKTPCRAW